MTVELPLQGRRLLVLAEYAEYGGTREYFKRLIDLYSRNGAYVYATTSYEDVDDEMQEYLAARDFHLETFSSQAAIFGGRSAMSRPLTWSRRGFEAESEMFRLMVKELAIDQVVISIGTSGRFLSAVAANPNSVMLAHGYPHGIRQQLFGNLVHGARLPRDLTLVTVSEFSLRQFDRFWNLGSKGVRTRAVHSTCGPGLAVTNMGAGSQQVLTAALLESTKNPVDWMKIAEQTTTSMGCGGANFVWLGDGPLLESSRALAREKGLANVEFPGWSNDVHRFYRASRVYLQTSTVESLGLSVVDAIRHGIPCVVSDCGGLPEIVDHGVNGFVYPSGDTRQAAEYVKQLLTDDDLQQRQAEACLAVYRDRFDEAKWEQKLLAAHQG